MSAGAVSHRQQVISLYLAYSVAGLFWGVLAATLPALQTGAGLGDGAFGLALGLMALAAFPVMRVFGRALHRIETIAIPACALVFSSGGIVLGFWPNLTGILIGFAICGGASGALDISLNNRTARVETATGLRLFNRTHAVFPAAMLVASVATGALRSWEVPLWVPYGVVTVLFVLSAWIEWRAGADMTPATADAPAPDGGVSALTGLVLILGLIAAAGAFQEAAANAWAAIYVENVRDGGPFLAGLSAAAFTLGLTVGRLGAHEIEHRFRALAVTAVAAGIAGASFIAIAIGVHLNLSVALFFLAGVGVGPIEPAVFRAVATRTDGPARGRTLATVTAIAYLGYLISPPALGLVADGLGWTAFWVASAAASAGAGILALRMMAMGRQSL